MAEPSLEIGHSIRPAKYVFDQNTYIPSISGTLGKENQGGENQWDAVIVERKS